jgi:Taurine catabolism dioxygenase TauD, TfdA family
MTARSAISSVACWAAQDVSDPEVWTTWLQPDQRRAIVDTARAAAQQGLTPETLQADVFDLPVLRDQVAEWNDALHIGRGFVLLRGFPTEELTEAETELAYVGLGSQLGSPVSQDAVGSLLGHVRDEGVVRTEPCVRLYRTNKRQDFHTDGADIVGLLCLQRARSGGESRIASAATVYNRMLAMRPDLIDVLYQPMYWDRNNEESPGEEPFYALPVLNDVDGTPRMFFIGWYIRDAQRHFGVPRLTEAQTEALELIESVANDPSVYLPMDFQPGDIQLIANAKILHCREAYEDDPYPSRRRHLLRLWLAARRFASVDDVLRGGIPPRKTQEAV